MATPEVKDFSNDYGDIKIIQVNSIWDIREAKGNLEELEQEAEEAAMDMDEAMKPIAETLKKAAEAQQAQIDGYKGYLNAFSSKYLSRNIEHLIKLAKLNMYDLDNAAGVSRGYIAKGAGEDSKKRLSIDVVWKIARAFNVNIDDLVNADLSEPTGQLKEMLDFVEGLKASIDRHESHWEIYEQETDETGYLLFHKDKDGEIIYINDSYRDAKLSPVKEIYYADIHGMRMFIVKLADETYGGYEYDLYGYDLEAEYNINYSKDDALARICGSALDFSGQLGARLEKLYNAASAHERDFVITEKARGFMDRVLGKTEPQQSDDEGLPFI